MHKCSSCCRLATGATPSFTVHVAHCTEPPAPALLSVHGHVQGKVKVNDTIELPEQKVQRKVKSLQVFRQSVSSCEQVGVLCMLRVLPPSLPC